jgi:hypothetical protein
MIWSDGSAVFSGRRLRAAASSHISEAESQIVTDPLKNIDHLPPGFE